MTFNPALLELMEDTITIEPFTGLTSSQAPTYGAAVTYTALVTQGARRTIDRSGRDVVSNIQVLIPERVFVDQRSRITLPVGYVPQTPPIMGVEPLHGLGLDHTLVLL